MERLDVVLVQRGLARSREQARRWIEAGAVRVDGVVVGKAAMRLGPGAEVLVAAADRFVSRGGLKLEGALDYFGIEVRGRRCLDVGISTGGFTDCLLQRGAAEVVGVDVGHGQTVARIREDVRVRVLEGVDARELTRELLGGEFEVVVMDVSFISARKVVPVLGALAGEGADLVVLVKPQFEVGRGRVGKGGIVRDAEARREAVAGVEKALQAEAVWETFPAWASPLGGADGNREYFLWARKRSGR